MYTWLVDPSIPEERISIFFITAVVDEVLLESIPLTNNPIELIDLAEASPDVGVGEFLVFRYLVAPELTLRIFKVNASLSFIVSMKCPLLNS